MAFQFPDPNVQNTVINPITGSEYVWIDPPGKWVVKASSAQASDIVYEGDSPPDPRGDYKLWYSTDTLELYFWYEDINGNGAWVPTAAPITMLEDLGVTVAEINTELQENTFKTDQLAAILTGMEGQITNLDQGIEGLQQEVDELTELIKSPVSIQYTLQYTTSSDTLAAGFFFWMSTILMYRRAAGDRIIPELKVGDELRLVKEDGTAIILEVDARLEPIGGSFKFRVTNKTPGVSLGNSEATDYFNLNFLFY